MEDKILKEIDRLLNELSENDPKGFENAIAIKSKIRVLIKLFTL
jgi:hypothetical protein